MSKLPQEFAHTLDGPSGHVHPKLWRITHMCAALPVPSQSTPILSQDSCFYRTGVHHSSRNGQHPTIAWSNDASHPNCQSLLQLQNVKELLLPPCCWLVWGVELPLASLCRNLIQPYYRWGCGNMGKLY